MCNCKSMWFVFFCACHLCSCRLPGFSHLWPLCDPSTFEALMTSYSCRYILTSVFAGASLRRKILFPYICRSCHLIFIFFDIMSNRPVHLYIFWSPPSLPGFSYASLLSLSLSFTPSQDKQPLFGGMSAICSKKLTKFLDAVQSSVPEGRGDYKFSAFSQSLPLFFIFLGLSPSLFFFSSNSLTTRTCLAWNSVIPRFVSFDALPPLCLTPCSRCPGSFGHTESVDSPLVCWMVIYVLSGRSPPINTRGEKLAWAHQFSCLEGSLCQVPLRVTRT